VRGSEYAVQLGWSRDTQQLLGMLEHFEAMGLGPGGGDAGVNVRLRYVCCWRGGGCGGGGGVRSWWGSRAARQQCWGC
jgi:hypothetical protein